MRLRTKLTLTIAVASVVPTLAATLVGRDLVRSRSRDEFAQLLSDGEGEVRSGFRQLGQEVAASVTRLADPDDQFLAPILIAQARGGINDEQFRQLAIITPRVMRERGLDVLTVVGPRGEVLALGHYPGRMGDHDPLCQERARLFPGKGPQLLEERLLENDIPENRLTMQVWLRASSLGTEVTVVGGRLLAPAMTRRLRLRGGTEVRIVDGKGAALGGSLAPGQWSRYAHYPRREVDLPGPGGRPAARVTLAVPDDLLRTTLHAINLAAGAVACSGLLLALLLGVLTARRITRPVQEVVDGAAAVAAGDLDIRLEVRGRDEMARLAEAFNQRVSELKESREKLLAAERVAAWREIARRIAHEIKNPLFPIQTSIETLRRVYEKKHPDFDEIFDESTTTILEEVARLKNIVTEFSRFARMPKPRLQPCDLGELVGSMVGLYSDDKVPVRWGPAPDLPGVLADRDQLTQVVANLLANARDAVSGRPDPRVELELTREGPTLLLSVQDNGEGFGGEVGARIFEPYFTTKERTGGTGLGLAIAHRIVTDHGGTIEARSTPGQGTRFLVRLPVTGP